MSENADRLRELLAEVCRTWPHLGGTALGVLDDLLAEQRVTGLDDSIKFFVDKQAELDRQRTAAKSLSNAEIADIKTESGRCGWAAQKLRDLKGRRKKGKGKTG